MGSGASTVVAAAGMHRFIWDLRYPNGGPVVPPGVYQVRLTVGDWRATESFELLIDPRVAADGVTRADLVEQAELGLKVRDAITEAREAIRQLTAARQSLEGKTDGTSRRIDERLAEMQQRLVTGPVRYDMPMLADQLQYLSAMINQADQRLGRDAFERYDELRAELDTVNADLETVLREIETGGV